jgi:integrase
MFSGRGSPSSAYATSLIFRQPFPFCETHHLAAFSLASVLVGPVNSTFFVRWLPDRFDEAKIELRARRVVGTAPTRKAPATSERVISMAIGSGDRLKDLRDRALLLLGFAGAFRRSELVALNVEDLEADAAGLKIHIRHSKTDQEGHGATIAVVSGSIACPVAALHLWLKVPPSRPALYSG